jgi:hypothetical protein
MLSQFEQRCLELRTRIARSRLRMDRHVRGAGKDIVQLLPLVAPTAARQWTQWLGLFLSGLALTRWKNPPRFISAWRDQVWGSFLGDGLSQLSKRLFVLARQAQRRRERSQESSDE